MRVASWPIQRIAAPIGGDRMAVPPPSRSRPVWRSTSWRRVRASGSSPDRAWSGASPSIHRPLRSPREICQWWLSTLRIRAPWARNRASTSASWRLPRSTPGGMVPPSGPSSMVFPPACLRFQALGRLVRQGPPAANQGAIGSRGPGEDLGQRRLRSAGRLGGWHRGRGDGTRPPPC